MKRERAGYVKAHAERLSTQADVVAGRLVRVRAVENALHELEAVVRGARDTIAGPAKQQGQLDRLATADLGAWLYEYGVARGLDIVQDARRELARAQQEAGRDA